MEETFTAWTNIVNKSMVDFDVSTRSNLNKYSML